VGNVTSLVSTDASPSHLPNVHFEHSMQNDVWILFRVGAVPKDDLEMVSEDLVDVGQACFGGRFRSNSKFLVGEIMTIDVQSL
jgi:hypothetical protein